MTKAAAYEGTGVLWASSYLHPCLSTQNVVTGLPLGMVGAAAFLVMTRAVALLTYFIKLWNVKI